MGAGGASIPTPLTLGLFDVVSVRRPVGRRKDTTALVGIARCERVLPRAADVPYSGGQLQYAREVAVLGPPAIE